MHVHTHTHLSNRRGYCNDAHLILQIDLSSKDLDTCQSVGNLCFPRFHLLFVYPHLVCARAWVRSGWRLRAKVLRAKVLRAKVLRDKVLRTTNTHTHVRTVWALQGGNGSLKE